MTATYFDYNATTPIDPKVFQAMEPYFTQHFGNPSSFHQMGQKSAWALKDARRKAASFFHAAEDSEIIFTSGGTESNTTAILSALSSHESNRMVTTAVEHSSVLKCCQHLVKEKGLRLQVIGVDHEGVLNRQELEEALQEPTALVSVMAANNETGVLFPIEEISRLVKSKKILFHVDAVQAAGKIPLDMERLQADYVSFSAHKLYGPKGTGILYARRGAPLLPLIVGGSQEWSRRGGTENLPGIVGFGKACELLARKMDEEAQRLKDIRDFFEAQAAEKIPAACITAQKTPRLPNTSHMIFENIESEVLLAALDQRGIYASSGSACMSGSREPSHVLKAMGFSDQEARSAVRFSFGKETTREAVTNLVFQLEEIIKKLSVNTGFSRTMSGAA